MKNKTLRFRAALALCAGFLCIFSAKATTLNPVADFDGDGKTDISVFRPSDGYWYIMKSSGGYSFIQWGIATDEPVPGDYDGDGKYDVAVYRAGAPRVGALSSQTDNSNWYILRSSDNSVSSVQFGVNGSFIFDKPQPADYDGDGKTDLGLYRLSDGLGVVSEFTIIESSSGSKIRQPWGYNTERYVPADYDGDGRADAAVFHPRGSFAPSPTDRSNRWFILQSSDGKTRIEHFGLETDRLVPADYDGDGKTDVAVFRPSNGYWYWLSSRDGSFNSYQFGMNGDKPVPGDYDGDGKYDFAVFRPSSGVWYIQQSKNGFRAEQFGLSNDVPIPNVFVPKGIFE